MSFASDIESDFTVVDDVETVSYQQRTLAGASTAYTGVSAWKTATRQELTGAGPDSQVVLNVCRWHVRASTLAVTPRKTDRIVSTTYGTWEVRKVDTEVLDGVHVLTCQKV